MCILVTHALHGCGWLLQDEVLHNIYWLDTVKAHDVACELQITVFSH